MIDILSIIPGNCLGGSGLRQCSVITERAGSVIH